MVDCGATGDCAIPMWAQSCILLAMLVLFAVRTLSPKDPYDRR